MITICRSVLLSLSLVAAFACAQQKPAPEAPPTSTVSGRVFCADTNTPARIATVSLVPESAFDNYQPGEESKVSVHGEAVDSSIDGSFSIPRVAPGTYYVIASMYGYISPVDALYFPSDAENPAAKKPAPAAPRITVQSGLPVSVNVSIERGAAASGTILYDDGSPASGVQISLQVKWKDKWISIPYSPYQKSPHIATTDDRGEWRIPGLPPGTYLLQASLQLSRSEFSVDRGSSGSSIMPLYSMLFYSGGKTRPTDAKPFTLSAGEERPGEDMEIPVSKLHTVRGQILAARDGHVVNGGDATLLYADDKSIAAHATLSQGDDNFNFSFVPEGDYILRVDSAADVEYTEIPNPPGFTPRSRTETKAIHHYSSAEQSIHLTGDLTGLSISVPDVPQNKLAAGP